MKTKTTNQATKIPCSDTEGIIEKKVLMSLGVAITNNWVEVCL